MEHRRAPVCDITRDSRRRLRAVEVALGVLGGLALVLAVVVGGAIVVGRSLPVAHTASRETQIAATPERVWPAIEGPALLRARGVGDVKFETVESVAPRRLVRRIVGERDFGGTWTIELTPAGSSSTTVRITENGEIYNAFFRFISRYAIGHHRTIDSFIAALRNEVEPQGR
jgi:hypothetical protein